MFKPSKFLACALVSYSLVSLYVSVSLLRLAVNAGHNFQPRRKESFAFLPGEHDAQIRMQVEETVHYRHPNNGVSKEWFFANPQGAGSFRPATDAPTLFVTMLHQHHCVETFGEQLTRTNRTTDWGHLQHCMNFLRELSMCRPDLTLEPGDFTQRDFQTERFGAVHVCRNLDPVYDILNLNWKQWAATRAEREHKVSAGSLDGHHNHKAGQDGDYEHHHQ